MSSLLCSLFLFVVFYALGCPAEQAFVLVGVSGTLQDGFELRDRLDYVDNSLPRTVEAQFVGKALVRGYKAYLDVKRQGWREYEPEPGPPRVPNPVVLPTGCTRDANVYWLYLVAPQQVLHILAGEPRFLSITPDTGLVDLEASETSENVRRLAMSQIRKRGHANTTAFALPLVTGVWFDADSFVESPVVYVQEDGTRVTSFDGSLALWASVDRDHLLEKDLAYQRNQAWQAAFQKIRETEGQHSKAAFPELCNDEIRFGVSNDHLRLNYPLTQNDIRIADLRDEL